MKVYPTYYEIVDIDHFKFDIYFDPRMLNVGITIGPTVFEGKMPTNIFIAIDILFWSLEFEFKKEKGA